MVNTKKNKTALYIILALFIIIVAFLFAASFITSVGYDARRTALTAEAIAAYDVKKFLNYYLNQMFELK